jgi:putative addiction module CopG family antidote
MEIHLSPDQEAFIRQAIASGRYQTADDAIHDALARWEQNERARIELTASLDEAEADLEAGRYTDYTAETLPKLVDELKREGRALRQQP